MQKKLTRSLEELHHIVVLTAQFFEQESIDPALRHIVDLCIEELFVNMVTYDTETQEEILLEMRPHEHGVEVSLTDYDVERFDPRSAPAVDINAPLEEREPGGLGLYLVLKMVDSIHYEYRNRQSRITFVAERKTEHV